MIHDLWVRAIPDKNLAVPTLFCFFGSKGKTNFGTPDFFFFGDDGSLPVCSVSLGGRRRKIERRC
jgi:hypothetical protein